MLKSSMSFNDLLIASSDKMARMEPSSIDAINVAKRKYDEEYSVNTPNKKMQSKQGKQSSVPKMTPFSQMATDIAIGQKLDIKMGSKPSMDKSRKEIKDIALSKGSTENADAHNETSCSQTAPPTLIETTNVPKAIFPSLIPSQGDKNFGQSIMATAFQSQVDGEKNKLKSKGPIAPPLIGNYPRLSTYASPSAQVETKETNVKTEDNFKGVAKAAVLNLIQNACNAKVTSGNSITEDSDSEESSPSFKKSVDTSTAHVQALTSANWMSVCSSSSVPPKSDSTDPSPVLSASDDQTDSKLVRSRRASLSADERANLNRDRNREHARNTRLRKKAYVEELKKTLTDLVTQRDAAELEKRHEKQRDLEVREVRFRVMEEFLKLRARGSDANLLARWIAILEDGFTLTLPRTDYRQMVGPKVLLPNYTGLLRSVTAAEVDTNPVNASIQVLKGAAECMDDALKLHHFANSLGRIGPGRSQNSVSCNITCDKNNFMMDGVNAFLEWNLVTSGATQKVSISFVLYPFLSFVVLSNLINTLIFRVAYPS